MSPSNLPSDISISPLLSFFFFIEESCYTPLFSWSSRFSKVCWKFLQTSETFILLSLERLKKLLKSLLKTKTNQYYKHLTESYSLPSLSNFCSFNLWECWLGCADVSWWHERKINMLSVMMITDEFCDIPR